MVGTRGRYACIAILALLALADDPVKHAAAMFNATRRGRLIPGLAMQ
jgi:hypothetical protein